MIKNIFVGWYNRIFNKNKDLYNKRMEICNTCDSKLCISSNFNICKECGCELSAKTRVKSEKCLLNKW